MNEHRGDRGGPPPGAQHRPEHDHGPDGPADTGFLDLEMSKVIVQDAEKLIPEVAREILRDAVRERVEERLGERLREVGRLIADAAVDDIEANLKIESA